MDIVNASSRPPQAPEHKQSSLPLLHLDEGLATHLVGEKRNRFFSALRDFTFSMNSALECMQLLRNHGPRSVLSEEVLGDALVNGEVLLLEVAQAVLEALREGDENRLNRPLAQAQRSIQARQTDPD